MLGALVPTGLEQGEPEGQRDTSQVKGEGRPVCVKDGACGDLETQESGAPCGPVRSPYGQSKTANGQKKSRIGGASRPTPRGEGGPEPQSHTGLQRGATLSESVRRRLDGVCRPAASTEATTPRAVAKGLQWLEEEAALETAGGEQTTGPGTGQEGQPRHQLPPGRAQSRVEQHGEGSAWAAQGDDETGGRWQVAGCQAERAVPRTVVWAGDREGPEAT